MKKVLLSIAFMAGVGCLSASAQIIQVPSLPLGNCASNSTTVTTNCGAKCYSEIQVSGNLVVFTKLTLQDAVNRFQADSEACERRLKAALPATITKQQ